MPARGRGSALTCQLGDIAPDGVAQVDISYTVDSAFPDPQLVNTASASSATPDPDLSNNQSVFTSSTGAQADLIISKLQTPVPPIAGAVVSWDLQVDNSRALRRGRGRDHRHPPGRAHRHLHAAGCTLDVLTATCPVGTLDSGDTSATFTIAATVPLTTADHTAITNTATVTSSTADPSPSSNTRTVTSHVVTRADLVVVKSTSPALPAGAGQPTFTIDVSNNGPSIAHNVRLVDVLPFDAIIELVEPASCTFSGINVECDLGDLAPGDPPISVVITYFTHTSVPPGTYTNEARATTTTVELNPIDNFGRVDVDVLPASVDLTVVKTGTPEVTAGAGFDYQIDVQNGGPSTAFDVVVTDVLPASFTPHSATTEFGSCTIVGQTVTCNLPFVYEPPFQEFNTPILISGTMAPDAPASVDEHGDRSDARARQQPRQQHVVHHDESSCVSPPSGSPRRPTTQNSSPVGRRVTRSLSPMSGLRRPTVPRSLTPFRPN